MNLISKFLPRENIAIDLPATSKKRVFEQAGLIFENQHGLARSSVFDALMQRERLGSTGLGQGVAIPHGRIKGIKDALGVFFRTAEPIQFEAPDSLPAQLIFVLLVPEQANEYHLSILSELAQMFSEPQFRSALLNATDVTSVYQLFQEWDPHATNERRSTV